MRTSAVLLAVAMTCLGAFSQQPRPTALTSKEVTDGWLLLFDGQSTFGWKVEGDAKVVDGVMMVNGGDKGCQLTTTTQFGDAELNFSFRGEKSERVQVRFLEPLMLEPAKADTWVRAWCKLNTHEGKRQLIGGSSQIDKNVKSTGNLFELGAPLPQKRSPISIEVPAGSKLQLKDIKLKPLGLQSIFNGKDLAGWKEHAGKKSKFAVIDGAINIKDGPGDLQSEGQWGDFTLQLECKSNGKHLNSGVFFRCIPDLYQQGYEAQVRNEFTAETREYVLEAFDPATNKPVEKRKVQSPAVDFGTGAIYRRMPARSAVAQDGEWFTMTVIANGRHLATWVNGIQQVDWTDHRAPADNARNGYRQAKGPISLQGHDPTTDLSFRGFRIAELP